MFSNIFSTSTFGILNYLILYKINHQRSNNRIIRPSADYIGVENSEWVDLKDRT